MSKDIATIIVSQGPQGPAGPVWDQIQGTWAAPTQVMASGSIPYPASCHRVLTYVVGSPGAVAASLAPGNADGDMHYIQGTNDTDSVTLSHTQQAQNGDYEIGLYSLIAFLWNAAQSTWVEDHRNGV